MSSTRSAPLEGFTSQRLFVALNNIANFNEVLVKVMDPVPDWTIDQSDEGNHYLKMNSAGQHHNSDGLGEGIVSLLFIVDALYDSNEGDLIVIDEPELKDFTQLTSAGLSVSLPSMLNRQIVLRNAFSLLRRF